MRIALGLVIVTACQPAPGAFRPQKQTGAPCMSLPALGPRPLEAPRPVIGLDLNGDGQADYAAPRLDTCDELDNCDFDVFWVRESCALYVGTVRAKDLENNGAFMTRELFTYEGEPGQRETWWKIGPPDYRYQEESPPKCRLEQTNPEWHRCDGKPEEGAPTPPPAPAEEGAPDAKSLLDGQPGGSDAP